MKLNFSDILYAFSHGLDCVESQLFPINAGHGKRVAALSFLLGKEFGFSDSELTQLEYLAALHDNALTEYLYEEYNAGKQKPDEPQGQDLMFHCIKGEQNIKYLPVQLSLKNAILYHHEEADGTGPFKKKADETPLAAQLIHMADVLDTQFCLADMDDNKYSSICSYLEENRNIRFSSQCVDTFINRIGPAQLCNAGKPELHKDITNNMEQEYSNEQIRRFCDLWIKIIDYKSEFTSRHSHGISCLAEKMGRFYGFDDEKCTALYFAGAVHDIGKLTIDSGILEKPGKLTESEFQAIQDHAYQSWYILKDVRGLEEVTKWAVHHHEKLNGQGYPFGKSGKDLCFEERLMACVDIYQALTESRPYKEGFTHEKAIHIMRDMAARDFIDSRITEDMANYLCPRAV